MRSENDSESEANPTAPRERQPYVPPVGVRLVDLEELEVEVEKLVAGGDGLARYQGVPIFIPRSAPGDRLKIRLVERRPDYGRAEIIEILVPGPGRREAPCPHFEQCGGCDLQHLEEDVQLRCKAQAVRETLERLGGVKMPKEVKVLPGKPFGYRLRTQAQVGWDDRGTRVGYFARRSHDLVAVQQCPVLDPDLEKAFLGLRASLPQPEHKRLDLALGDGGRWSLSPPVKGLPHGTLKLRVGEFEYEYDARCFFQGHRQLAAELVSLAVGSWSGEEAYDLYAGVGLFSLPLAKRYQKVVAVEGERVAARFARNNARRNRLPGLSSISQSVDSWIETLPEAVDRVLLDPPRAGLSRKVRAQLVQRRPHRITYVSCHAAALARDLKVLLRVYRLESLALLDMFPQTGHMEVVAQLVLAREMPTKAVEAEAARPVSGEEE